MRIDSKLLLIYLYPMYDHSFANTSSSWMWLLEELAPILELEPVNCDSVQINYPDYIDDNDKRLKFVQAGFAAETVFDKAAYGKKNLQEADWLLRGKHGQVTVRFSRGDGYLFVRIQAHEPWFTQAKQIMVASYLKRGAKPEFADQDDSEVFLRRVPFLTF